MKILYFAWLREKMGLAQEHVNVPADVTTVQALIDFLRFRSVAHAEAFGNESLIRCAVDQEFAEAGTAIAGATEIAFFPPVTGG